MSQHHPDPHHSHGDSNPVKLAIGVTIGAIALVIGIILLAKLAVGAYGQRDMKDEPAMKPDVVAKRIAPAATVAVDPNAQAAPPPAPAQQATAAPASAHATAVGAAAGGGQKTYDAVCAMCHNAGVAGAPKAGDKAEWSKRLAQGKDTLYASAIKGKGAMPPKGGNPSIPDADVRSAVDHLLATAK